MILKLSSNINMNSMLTTTAIKLNKIQKEVKLKNGGSLR